MTTQTAAPAKAAAPRAQSEYAILKQRVTAAGLLRRRPLYYSVKIASTLLLFVAGWVALVLIGASWWNVVTAVYLAVMSTQVAFIGHDVGHRQVFRQRAPSNRLSLLLGNLLLGMSTCWWNDKHNRHHGDPNTEGKDPDIASGAVVFTEVDAGARTSWAGRQLARNQAVLFFPMLSLEGLNLHVSSFRAMLGDTVKSKHMRLLETVLLLAHASLYLGAVFYVLTPVQGLVFIAVHQGLWGLYMGVSFAPNHKGMPILEAGNKLGHVRRQVVTARNIRGGWFTDWALGALNYQAEHHLFPNMPRPGLVRSQEIIRAFCDEIGVPITEVSFLRSYVEVLKHLWRVGRYAGSRADA